MGLSESAKELIQIIKSENKDNPDLKKTFSKGYDRFCNYTEYGHTPSGYKAWRRQVRIAFGEIPARKPRRKTEAEIKNDEKQMELF